jgi:uncharacterized protein (TIGR02145 family)
MLLGLFTISAQAKEVCDTIKECRQLQSKVEARLIKLLKNTTPELTEVLESHVTQAEAKMICARKGMRLPTARELALFSQSRGAQEIQEIHKDIHKDIIDTKMNNDEPFFKDGAILIKGRDKMGNPDYFYYNFNGYKHPDEEVNYKFWSSSTRPESEYSDYYYLMDTNEGLITSDWRGYRYSVRCVTTR